MDRIIYIGMDVHSTSYSLCALEPVFGQENKFFFETKVAAEPSDIIWRQLHVKIITNAYSVNIKINK